jgi:hypothetical protein
MGAFLLLVRAAQLGPGLRSKPMVLKSPSTPNTKLTFRLAATIKLVQSQNENSWSR